MTYTAVIFGGSGFFGTHLAGHLAEDPEVVRIVLADIREPRFTHAKADFVQCDVREPIDLAVEREVVIFNLAAVHTTPGFEDWEYYWTNVRGAIEVCRFATAIGARRIIFTSTMGIYGPQEEQVDERTKPRPVTAYGKSKLLAEKIHEDWQAVDPTRRLVTVRPSVTFGDGEHGNFERLASLLRKRRFVYPARKDTIKACAPVYDLYDCIKFMAAFDEPVIRFLYAYPERTTTEIINRAFNEAAGFELPTIVVPESIINMAALGFEVLSRLGLKTSINRARVKKLIQSTNLYPHELVSRGWRFKTSLPEALRRWKAESDFK
ncbi:NAD(P)-dependent oxidoreductase [uncultured Devosia sp.]|uniref:NAD-dependent epimerase/dehydratase family protein n=1 Tax=uncultured Devosia sp. TaxID=211434 RepID=UPI002637F3C4|nr:NAD(P)-dependent oxidoreductase [uncultured Devosia sp.]